MHEIGHGLGRLLEDQRTLMRILVGDNTDLSAVSGVLHAQVDHLEKKVCVEQNQAIGGRAHFQIERMDSVPLSKPSPLTIPIHIKIGVRTHEDNTESNGGKELPGGTLVDNGETDAEHFQLVFVETSLCSFEFLDCTSSLSEGSISRGLVKSGLTLFQNSNYMAAKEIPLEGRAPRRTAK
eukprot:CAMPEP_0194366258 /NCGR_PEP_ID=MMETSP0174-20130528/14284_1 /TAXON_ID=216777 /ORGANISM="Proboscia alata, Strain PI-D3" /LENGTH=179 /DNA_ID=CAMNT_0039141337 /DNA_START=517 /DNA_END=1053 /DNA_ORIENTATION=+